ncbi:MAG: UDP-N-acetylglucosamine 1-carboxyvinyltransferase [Candidatus Choladocola sp.]|nr:UDP-N-acetylglucosamine 1-carboxyvinyltransferase [Candidatus Choladocola sp.]
MGLRYIEAEGGVPLRGEIEVQGSKNAVLPILAACLLGETVCTIENCPSIGDVDDALMILKMVGCKVRKEGSTVLIDASEAQKSEIGGAEAVRIRSSVLFLGALLGKIGKAVLPLPGGCAIGQRPVDLHIEGLTGLGAEFIVKDRITASASELRGCRIRLRIPSVGATENIILAAVQAEGETVIENAACEPEILELCRFLNRRGAEISGKAGGSIHIRGTKRFLPVVYRMSGDRIVAGTYLLAAAATGGSVCIRNFPHWELNALLSVLKRMGVGIEVSSKDLLLHADGPLSPVPYVETSPFPGFPTDLQSPLMAVLCRVPGKSRICEKIFENRFRTAGELNRMGARIGTDRNTACIDGVNVLHGAVVDAPDLRGGAALVIAGLQADGRTIIRKTEYIERGYEDICRDLRRLGANISLRDGL